MSVYYNRSTNSGAKVPTILTKHTQNVQRYHRRYKLDCIILLIISSIAQKQTTIACKKVPTFSIWVRWYYAQKQLWKSWEDAWWYQVPQSGKDLSAGTNCEFVPGGLIKVWPALKSPSSCPRLYFLKKNLFVLFYFCVTWTKIISTGARLNSSVSSCHYDLFNLAAWWTRNHEVPSSTCPHVLANISRCELLTAGRYQRGRASI